jgi:hypothetical protein
MKQVVLNEEQLKALDAFLQELPMKQSKLSNYKRGIKFPLFKN